MPSPNRDRRSERARRAILQTALDLCVERGLARTTMDEIAKRAGVGKQTIYRWWPTKAAVVLEALTEQAGDLLDVPDTGDLLADLRTQLTGLAELLAGKHCTAYASLIGAAQDDPDLAGTVVETIMEPWLRACRERLRRGQEQQQLRADVDVDDVIELLYGPLYYRFLLRTRPATPEQVTTILSLTFDGLHHGPGADVPREPSDGAVPATRGVPLAP
jgi:AcrR family transcriptional regulator